MPIQHAQDATDVAVAFLSKYYYWRHVPKSARRNNGEWVVSVDVGLFVTELATVTIDAATSQIVSYDMPGSPARQ
mgnify:CR=1 FL=1